MVATSLSKSFRLSSISLPSEPSILSTSINAPIGTPKASFSLSLPAESQIMTVNSADTSRGTKLNAVNPRSIELLMSPSGDLSDNNRVQSTGDETSFTYLIIGGAISSVAAIVIIIVTVLATVAAWVKTRKINKESIGGTTDNVANGTAYEDRAAHIYPKPVATGDIEMEQNNAYAMSIITDKNVVYVANGVTKKN